MKLKRGIALLLAAVFLFGTLAVPASAAAAQPGPAAQAQTVDAEENDIISVRIKASGELTYGADHKLEIQTTPADAQYIGVVHGHQRAGHRLCDAGAVGKDPHPA